MKREGDPTELTKREVVEILEERVDGRQEGLERIVEQMREADREQHGHDRRRRASSPDSPSGIESCVGEAELTHATDRAEHVTTDTLEIATPRTAVRAGGRWPLRWSILPHATLPAVPARERRARVTQRPRKGQSQADPRAECGEQRGPRREWSAIAGLLLVARRTPSSPSPGRSRTAIVFSTRRRSTTFLPERQAFKAAAAGSSRPYR